MSYLTLSRMVRDSDLIERITACAASLKLDDPASVSRNHMWDYVTTEGWVERYATATTPKGQDEKAITDEMILAAVREVTKEEAT